MWERYIDWLPLTPQLGTWPTTQACALTGNGTGDPLVLRLALTHWATPAGAMPYFFLHTHSQGAFTHHRRNLGLFVGGLSSVPTLPCSESHESLGTRALLRPPLTTDRWTQEYKYLKSLTSDWDSYLLSAPLQVWSSPCWHCARPPDLPSPHFIVPSQELFLRKGLNIKSWSLGLLLVRARDQPENSISLDCMYRVAHPRPAEEKSKKKKKKS